METTCMSTPWASMSASRSSGVKRTLGELNWVRLPSATRVPRPSPASCRYPCQSRRASMACHSERGTRCAWMSMVLTVASSFAGLSRGEGHAAVDDQRLSGHPPRLVAGEVDGGPADVPAGAFGAERARPPAPLALLRPEVLHHGRPHQAGGDGVDA